MILGIAITSVRRCIHVDYENKKKKQNKTKNKHKQSVMIKRIDLNLVKHTDKLRFISKDGARCPQKVVEGVPI